MRLRGSQLTDDADDRADARRNRHARLSRVYSCRGLEPCAERPCRYCAPQLVKEMEAEDAV